MNSIITMIIVESSLVLISLGLAGHIIICWLAMKQTLFWIRAEQRFCFCLHFQWCHHIFKIINTIQHNFSLSLLPWLFAVFIINCFRRQRTCLCQRGQHCLILIANGDISSSCSSEHIIIFLKILTRHYCSCWMNISQALPYLRPQPNYARPSSSSPPLPLALKTMYCDH